METGYADYASASVNGGYLWFATFHVYARQRETQQFFWDDGKMSPDAIEYHRTRGQRLRLGSASLTPSHCCHQTEFRVMISPCAEG